MLALEMSVRGEENRQGLVSAQEPLESASSVSLSEWVKSSTCLPHMNITVGGSSFYRPRMSPQCAFYIKKNEPLLVGEEMFLLDFVKCYFLMTLV